MPAISRPNATGDLHLYRPESSGGRRRDLEGGGLFLVPEECQELSRFFGDIHLVAPPPLHPDVLRAYPTLIGGVQRLQYRIEIYLVVLHRHLDLVTGAGPELDMPGFGGK